MENYAVINGIVKEKIEKHEHLKWAQEKLLEKIESKIIFLHLNLDTLRVSAWSLAHCCISVQRTEVFLALIIITIISVVAFQPEE